jgi:carboxyl-terminal processing protease
MKILNQISLNKSKKPFRVHHKAVLGVVALLLVLTVGCHKEDDIAGEIVPAEIRSVNNYIKESMDNFYLWNEFIPGNINPDRESDPEIYFDKILYKLEDKWSYITDDYQELINHFSGIEYSFGHHFKLFREEGTDNVFGIIQYVVKDSPAEIAGLDRGDVFSHVNGQRLTVNNYRELLFEKDAYMLGLANLVDGAIIPGDEEVNLTARQFQENPVLMDSVYNLSGRNIGYFVYTQFISDFNDELEKLFGKFKSGNVTDLIVDLRYNPGGSISTARLLASLIAPSDPVNNGSVFARYIWNDIIEQYWLDEEGAESNNLMIRFLSTVNNLNLGRVYFLVSGNSASASETLINGLLPYMEVVLLGETTSGKYTGSITLHDEKKSFNWAIQPIVLKAANANGETEFRNGFPPDYLIKDDLFSPLGSFEEEMLSEALALITGIPGDQLARKKPSEFPERAEEIMSGGRIPVDEEQELWIDHIKQ